MDISLTPDLEQLVAEKLRTGPYRSPSEVIHEGLQLLRDRDREIEALRLHVQAGFEDMNRGDYTDYDENNIHELVERVKARGLLRLRDEASLGAR